MFLTNSTSTRSTPLLDICRNNFVTARRFASLNWTKRNEISVMAVLRLIKIANLFLVLGATTSVAQDCDEQCQAARKAQDPLAHVRAIFNDNTIGYGSNVSDTTYNFQIQLAYTIEVMPVTLFCGRSFRYWETPAGREPSGASVTPSFRGSMFPTIRTAFNSVSDRRFR